MEQEFEYYETTSEMDEGDASPPKGTGWELMEVFQSGRLRIHRWRRPAAPTKQSPHQVPNRRA